MASMNRNLNLEEVNSDAFMGIPFLNHQSLLQKAIFIGSVVLAVAMNLIGNFALHANPNLVVGMTLLPLAIGIALGCNYNEDLSLIKYIALILFKPAKTLRTNPTEDVVQLRSAADRIHQEQELKNRKAQKATPEEQRKLLLKLIIGVVVVLFIFVGAIVAINLRKTEEIHHTIDEIQTEGGLIP